MIIGYFEEESVFVVIVSKILVQQEYEKILLTLRQE